MSDTNGKRTRTLDITEPQFLALKLIASRQDTSRQALISAAIDALISGYIKTDPVLAVAVGREYGMSWEQIESAMQAERELDSAALRRAMQ